MRLLFSIAVGLALVLAGERAHPGVSRTARKGGYRPAPPSAEGPARRSDLAAAIRAYEKEPSEDLAAAVWEGFDELDSRIANYRQEAAETVAGPRAEAEITRIELQRARDEQMTRFLFARNRWKEACAAFDALAESGDTRSGVQNAAAILVHGYRRAAEMRAEGTLRP